MDFRCSAASAADGEPLAGSAPTETEWLFLEHPGPWGRKAVAESRLPAELVAHLGSLPARVQLIRRYGGATGPTTRVLHARLGPRGAEVRGAELADPRELLDAPELAPYDAPLWLVCTNGRRDVCCAELGRPVAAALAEHWPEDTWETTHLGGHRFSATLLALPSGVTLGRTDPARVVDDARALLAGRVPLEVSRGRAGIAAVAQVAELHVLRAGGGAADDVEVEVVRVEARGDGHVVEVRAGARIWAVDVATVPGAPRRASCADLTAKAAPLHEVRAAVALGP